MTTYVLVHGAWHGGWAWAKVARRLEAAGHQVSRPTLTGLGERAHLLSQQVDLSLHVQDVIAHLRFEDLHDVVLVGHSYAGLVITGVADLEPARVRHLIYYDAFVPDDGESALDLLPEHVARHFVQSADADGDGWRMPRRPLSALGVRDPQAIAWLEPRLTEHPLATYTQKLFGVYESRGLPSTYLSCTDWAQVFRPQADRAMDLGWPVTDIATDHEALATAPDVLVEAITASVP